jgi:hypothetical protein
MMPHTLCVLSYKSSGLVVSEMILTILVNQKEDLLMVVLFFAMSNFCRGCNKHHSRNIWLQLAVVYNDDDNDNGKKSE